MDSLLVRKRKCQSPHGEARSTDTFPGYMNATELAALDDILTSILVDSALGFRTHKMHPLSQGTIIHFARDQVFIICSFFNKFLLLLNVCLALLIENAQLDAVMLRMCVYKNVACAYQQLFVGTVSCPAVFSEKENAELSALITQEQRLRQHAIKYVAH